MQTHKFTKQEKKFIDECFQMTLDHFITNPLTRDNPEDILKAVNYRNYYIGQIGITNHQIMWSIFDKMGYCKDGKMTKADRERQKEAEHLLKLEQWKQESGLAIAKIDAKIQELEEIKKDILSHEVAFDKKMKIKEKQVKAALHKQMDIEREVSQQKTIDTAMKKVNTMTLRELRVVARDKKIKNFSRMSKADLLAQVEAA